MITLQTVAAVLVTLLVIGVSAVLLWRYTARTTTLPCPPWLAWMLELRVMRRNAGVAAVIERLRLEPGMRVADIGCGPGRLTIPIAERVGGTGDVVALDLQPEMLKRLERRIAGTPQTNIRPIHAGAGDGALPENYFDRAVLVTVLGEIPDRLRALKEICRALKPGGFLSITEVVLDPHYQRMSTVRALATEAGLEWRDAYRGKISYTVHLYKPAE